MKSVFKYHDTTWIDLTQPESDEIKEAAETFSLDPLIVRSISSPSARHKIEPNLHYIYVVLHFPTLNRETNLRVNQEIDFVIGKNFIITAHYEPIEAINNFAKRLEVSSILEKHHPEATRDFIFFGLLRELSNMLIEQLSDIEDWMKDVEGKVFKGEEKKMVFALSDVSRHLLDFKKSTLPYHEVFHGLEIHGSKLFGEDFIGAVEVARSEFAKIEHTTRMLSELVSELRETNNSLLTTKQNEFIKTLTMMNVVIAVMVGIALIWLGYLAIQ